MTYYVQLPAILLPTFPPGLSLFKPYTLVHIVITLPLPTHTLSIFYGQTSFVIRF